MGRWLRRLRRLERRVPREPEHRSDRFQTEEQERAEVSRILKEAFDGREPTQEEIRDLVRACHDYELRYPYSSWGY